MPGMSVCLTSTATCDWMKAVGEHGNASLAGAPPGGDVNRTNRYGTTALMMACRRGHLAVVEALLAVPGIDVNKRDNNGWTALTHACRHGCYLCLCGVHDNSRVVELLALHGADMTGQDIWGEEIAYTSCCGSHDDPRVLEMLALYGADMTARCARGCTPLHAAVYRKKSSIVSFLLTLPEVCDMLDVRDVFQETAEKKARNWGYHDIEDMIAAAVRFECETSCLLKHMRAIHG